MSGDLLEKSINQSSWREWLKRGNLLFMALTKTNTNFIRFLIDYFISLRPKAIDQPIESTINLTTQFGIQQQIDRRGQFQSIISDYSKRQMSEQTSNTLEKVKQLNNSGNVVEAYSLLSQVLIQSNNKDKAIKLLKAGVKKIQQLKQQGSTVYIEDQLDLRQKLILLQAVKSKSYRESLKQLNNIYDAYLLYFLDQRIILLNNLSLKIQKSQRPDKYQESIAIMNEALHLLQKYVLSKDERVYFTLNNLACAYFQNGELNQAHKLFNKLFKQMSSQGQKYDQILKICQNNYKYYFSKQIQ